MVTNQKKQNNKGKGEHSQGLILITIVKELRNQSINNTAHACIMRFWNELDEKKERKKNLEFGTPASG